MADNTHSRNTAGVLRKAGGALAAAAAVPVACIVAMFVAQLWLLLTQARPPLASDYLLLVWFATPLGALWVVVAGLPAAALLARRGRTSARDFALCGAALGALPFLLFAISLLGFQLLGVSGRGWHDAVRRILELLGAAPVAVLWLTLFAWCGCCAALAYWWVVIDRRSPLR